MFVGVYLQWYKQLINKIKMNELEQFKGVILDKITDLKNNKSSIVVEGKELEYENILLGYYQILNTLINKP